MLSTHKSADPSLRAESLMHFYARLVCGILLALSLVSPVMPQAGNRPTDQAQDGRVPGSLPFQKLGADDLVGVFVYEAPELSGNFRVAANGTITLPILKTGVKVSGLYPTEAAKVIAEALKTSNVLINPLVSVAVAEYRSRPITVVGAVHKPLTFQATSGVRLLDAVSMCEGLSETAGPEIIITRTADDVAPGSAEGAPAKSRTLVQRISVKGLLDGRDPALNVALNGGEEIRVPEAGKVFVVGNVKKPGAFPVRDADESSVLRALSVSEGLEPYASHIAYIYRVNPATSDGPADGKSASQSANQGRNQEIPVELQKIIERKAPDVALKPGDILYVPDRTGRRNFANVMAKVMLIGGGMSAAAIYAIR